MASKAVTVAAWESLFRAQVTVMRKLGTEFPTDEISLTEYDVLFNLSRQPSRALRIRDLVQDLLITQPSVSRLVDRLAARALIEKRPDPADARGSSSRSPTTASRCFVGSRPSMRHPSTPMSAQP